MHITLLWGINMNYFYSATTNGFYSKDFHGENIPDDAVEITYDDWQSLINSQSTTKMIASDDRGYPIIVDRPSPTPEQLITINSEKKTALIAEATVVISPLKDALDGGYIDESDKPLLAAWQKYRYDLTKVDPASPVWPEPPQ